MVSVRHSGVDLSRQWRTNDKLAWCRRIWTRNRSLACWTGTRPEASGCSWRCRLASYPCSPCAWSTRNIKMRPLIAFQIVARTVRSSPWNSGHRWRTWARNVARPYASRGPAHCFWPSRGRIYRGLWVGGIIRPLVSYFLHWLGSESPGSWLPCCQWWSRRGCIW